LLPTGVFFGTNTCCKAGLLYLLPAAIGSMVLSIGFPIWITSLMSQETVTAATWAKYQTSLQLMYFANYCGQLGSACCAIKLRGLLTTQHGITWKGCEDILLTLFCKFVLCPKT